MGLNGKFVLFFAFVAFFSILVELFGVVGLGGVIWDALGKSRGVDCRRRGARIGIRE